jgi:hypothetical protein
MRPHDPPRSRVRIQTPDPARFKGSRQQSEWEQRTGSYRDVARRARRERREPPDERLALPLWLERVLLPPLRFFLITRATTAPVARMAAAVPIILFLVIAHPPLLLKRD